MQIWPLRGLDSIHVVTICTLASFYLTNCSVTVTKRHLEVCPKRWRIKQSITMKSQSKLELKQIPKCDFRRHLGTRGEERQTMDSATDNPLSRGKLVPVLILTAWTEY